MIKEIDLQRPQDRHHLHGALHDGVFLVRSTLTQSLLQEAYGFLSAFFDLTPEQKRTCRVPGGTGLAGYTPPLAQPGQSRAGGRRCRSSSAGGPTLPAGHPLRMRYPARYLDPYFPDHLVPGIGAALRELHTRMLRLQHEVLAPWPAPWAPTPTTSATCCRTAPPSTGPPGTRRRRTPCTAQQAQPHHGGSRAAGGSRTTPGPGPGPGPRAGHGLGLDPGLGLGLITTVPRAAAAGPEVCVEGQWLPAEAPPGYAVVTVGLVLDRLTGGLARAAAHRAAPPPGHDEGRLSLAQCCHPAPWTILTPLRPPGAADGPQRFATLTADELFQRTLYRTGRPGAPGTAAPAR